MDSCLLNESKSLLEDIYTPNGDIFKCTGIENNGDNLSHETYVFLKQKLTEANATIASYVQRESNLSAEVEQLKREKQDAFGQIGLMKSELQNLRAKCLACEQKVEAETRQRFTLQDKLTEFENASKDKDFRNSLLEGKIKELTQNLSSSENCTKQVYKLAMDACEQNKDLKEQIKLLEEMLLTCKTTISQMQDDQTKMVADYDYMKSEYTKLESTFQEGLDEIDAMKEDSCKQTQFITDTLNRFKEVGIHFHNMKTQFLEQHNRLEEHHKDMKERWNSESEMKNEAVSKLKEFDQLNQKAAIRELESKNKIEKLESALNEMELNRQKLEEKCNTDVNVIENLRDELSQIKVDATALHSVLTMERNQNEEIKLQLEKEKRKKEGLKLKCEGLQESVKQLETTNSKMENENSYLNTENLRLSQNQERVEATNVSLKAEQELLKEENLNLKNTIEAKEQDIRQFVEDENNIEIWLKQRYNEFTKIQDEYSKVVNAKDSVVKENKTLHNELKLLKMSNETNLKASAEREEKLQNCQYLFMQQEESIKTMSEKIKELSNECARNERIIEELSHDVKILQENLKESYAEAKTCRNELDNTKRELEKEIQEKEKIKGKLTEKLERITLASDDEDHKLREACNEKDNTIVLLNKQLQEYTERIESGKIHVSKSNERINLINSRNESLSEENNRLSAQMKCLEKTIGMHKMAEEELKERLFERAEELKNMERCLEDQKKVYEEYKQEISSYEELWQSEQAMLIKAIQDELTKVHPISTNLSSTSLLEGI